MLPDDPIDRRGLLLWAGGAAALGALPWLGACGSSSSNCWPQVGFPPGLDWGPYVALPTPRSMLVVWRSSAAVVGAVDLLERGPAEVGAGPDFSQSRAFVESGSGTHHAVELTGLTPGRRHAYRIRHGRSVVGAVHAFRTPSAVPEEKLRFAVVGDSGSGCPAEFEVVRVMRDMQADLVLHVGDLVYNTPTPDRIRARHFWPFAGLIDHVPLYPVWGNHDVKGEGWARMLAALHCPANDADGSRAFYAFRRGPCHFVALNTANVSFERGSEQVEWLERRLAEPARWKIVGMHNPPYSSHTVPVAPAIRSVLVPLFEQHGVDIVFSGDAHFYERTYPVRSGKPTDVRQEPDYRGPRGPVYVTSGGGGGRLYPLGVQPLRAAGAVVYHALRVDVDRSTLTLVALGRDGKQIDRMRILKDG